MGISSYYLFEFLTQKIRQNVSIDWAERYGIRFHPIFLRKNFLSISAVENQHQPSISSRGSKHPDTNCERQMQQRRSEHQRRMDTTERHEVRASTDEIMPRKLIDAPPYSDIYFTSHGFEAIRSDAQKKVSVAEYDKRIAEYSNNVKGKTYEEDVDAEADEFIKQQRKKFQQSKWSSMNGG